MDLTPSLVLSMWTAGIAVSAAIVVRWSIVGTGFSILAGIIVVLFGGVAAASGAGLIGWLAVAAAMAALVSARRPIQTMLLFTTAGGLMLVAGFADSPVLLVLSGALAIGGITAQMMLGHWYLVDPRLPRWALQTLVLGAGTGLLIDVGFLIAEGALSWQSGDGVLGWAFVALSVMTMLLVVAVSLALREPFYTAVMAATGLSYLAVLTTFGAVVLGRMLVF